MEEHQELTHAEALAQGVRWRPSDEVAQQRLIEQGVGRRHLTLPALEFRDWRGWMCKICLRMSLESVPPWSWFGCMYCRNVDAWAARAFGGRRLLPLGQHSIMNGRSIPLSMPDGPGRRAKARGLMAIGEGWRQRMAR